MEVKCTRKLSTEYEIGQSREKYVCIRRYISIKEHIRMGHLNLELFMYK